MTKKYNIDVLMTSVDHNNGTERCYEASQSLNLKGKDVILDIQGDEPFIHSESIDSLISIFEKERNTEIATLYQEINEKKYYHKVLGCNSRLDTIQAAILNVKIKHLDLYSQSRNAMASFYDVAFVEVDELEIPERQLNSTHVFHQYTLKVKNGKRNELQKYLSEKGIPSMIYYPLPLHKQEAFQQFVSSDFVLPTSEELCDQVLSLPIHTEMNIDKMNFICSSVQSFFKK